MAVMHQKAARPGILFPDFGYIDETMSSRRTERIANLIRNTIGQLLLSKIADPRIDPARTSITRVEVPEDLLTARIYISVIGSEADQRKALTALNGAAGHFQELLGKEIQLRNTPRLDFVVDAQFKKSIETYRLIQQAMQEIHQKEQAKTENGGDIEPAEPTKP